MGNTPYGLISRVIKPKRKQDSIAMTKEQGTVKNGGASEPG
jgi:hypothetical protein